MEHPPIGGSRPRSYKASEWILNRTDPPYVDQYAFKYPSPIENSDIFGSILVLSQRTEPPDWGTLRTLSEELRTEFPTLPVVLLLHDAMATKAESLRENPEIDVSGILVGGAATRERLRDELTSAIYLGEDVARWVVRREGDISQAASKAIAQLISGAATQTRVSPLLMRMDESLSTTRSNFRKWQLPSPHRWLQLGRALNSALRIQKSPDEPLLKIALSLGYSDSSGLSRNLNQTFGLGPSTIRGTLGWEWLLFRWWSRAITDAAKTSSRNSGFNG